MFRFFFKLFGADIIGRELRGVAEGKYGPRAQAVYVWLIGKKTWTSTVLGAAAVAALVLGEIEIGAGILAASMILLPAGLIDKNWRAARPYENQVWWQLLRNHGAEVTAALGYAAYLFTTCSPEVAGYLGRVHLTCGSAFAIVTALSAVTAWLIGEAKLTEGPNLRLQFPRPTAPVE